MEKSASLPIWIYKRDGRLAPFEADKISQSLFAAGESVGRPDAFTARELTDSVLHFLSAELNGAIPHTAQVADMVTKIVRELGQTVIAQAYADFAGRRALVQLPLEEPKSIQPQVKIEKPESRPDLPIPAALATVNPNSLVRIVAAPRLQDYSLHEIFTRDIAAAHREALITLLGLEWPFEMQGGILPWSQSGQLARALEESRAGVGQFIALDGPEFGGPGADSSLGAADTAWVPDFLFGLRSTGLCAIVNLNIAAPPPWAQSLAAGPLFDTGPAPTFYESGATGAEKLLNLLCSQANESVHVHWHLSEPDWLSKNEPRMARLAKHILNGAPITIVFDRPHRPISLAEGLDRRQSSLLISVGLHLPGLIRQLGDRATPELFLQKLGSLARLAITAAVQKRRFLNRYRRHRSAFVVDRARLAIVPVGLESVTRALTGHAILPGTHGADFAFRIIHCLHEILRDEGPRYNLEVSVDAASTLEPWPVMGRLSHFKVVDLGIPSPPLNLEEIAGLTTWNGAIPPRDQVQVAGSLHTVTGTGTAWIQLPHDAPFHEEELVRVLRFAWKETQVSRIRFVNTHVRGRQLTASWETTAGKT